MCVAITTQRSELGSATPGQTSPALNSLHSGPLTSLLGVVYLIAAFSTSGSLCLCPLD